jgi:hypothetical protein
MTKVVINAGYGMFDLSVAAWTLLAQRKGGVFHHFQNMHISTCHIILPDGTFLDDDALDRTDADLVAVVEELGTDAVSTEMSTIAIVTIPDDVEHWYIDEYDGAETVYAGCRGRALKSKEVTI